MLPKRFIAIALTIAFAGTVQGQDDVPLTIEVKRLSMDTALTVAQRTIEQCRNEGMQVAVTVVDRVGQPQVVLRDSLTPELALNISEQKAYTAVTFKSATSALQGNFESPFSVAKVDGVLPAAGGLPIEAGGSTLGGVGVSGAPSGEIDERCAQAGVDAVQMDLEMGGF